MKNGKKPELDLSEWYGREIPCSCGRRHFCAIRAVVVCEGALDRLPALTEGFERIFLAADTNTWAVCGERVRRFSAAGSGGALSSAAKGRLSRTSGRWRSLKMPSQPMRI